MLGTRFTIDTLRLLLRRFPRVRFVWLMGADILVAVAALAALGGDRCAALPFAVLPRPGYTRRALAGSAAHRHARTRAGRARGGRLLPGDAPRPGCC